MEGFNFVGDGSSTNSARLRANFDWRRTGVYSHTIAILFVSHLHHHVLLSRYPQTQGRFQRHMVFYL